MQGFFLGGGVKIIYELFDRPSIVYMVRLKFLCSSMYIQEPNCVYRYSRFTFSVLIKTGGHIFQSMVIDYLSRYYSIFTRTKEKRN